MSYLFPSPLMLLFRCFHFSSELQNELIPAPHLKHRRRAFNKLHVWAFFFFFPAFLPLNLLLESLL